MVTSAVHDGSCAEQMLYERALWMSRPLVNVDGETQEQQVVRVALWHPRWTLLRASVCQLWWMLGLHGVASALGGPQKEVYAVPGAMKAAAWRAKTR